MNTSRVIERARSLHLRGVDSAVRELLTAAGERRRDRLAAVLLGRQTTVRLEIPPNHPALNAVVSALRYGVGMNLTVLPAAAGASELLSAEAMTGGKQSGVERDALRTLLAPSPSQSRLGPAPVLILSTAGDPELVRASLEAHLDAIGRFGHTGLRLAIVDDAAPRRSTQLTNVIAEAQKRTGVELVRFAEHEADGGPGPKATFRNALESALPAGPTLAASLNRVLSGTAYGSANAAFLLLAGQPLIWLEQDALPEAWHMSKPATTPSEVPAQVNRLAASNASDPVQIEWTEEHPQRPNGASCTPVDIVHIVDRILYGPAALPSYQQLHATWESPGYEWTRDQMSTALSPKLCYFHICGHADYRARFSHHVLTRATPPIELRDALLSGGLDRFTVFTRPPDPVVVRRGAFTFGTAVGFHHDLPLPTPMMAATHQRIFDFTVAAILQSAGDCPAAVAGTGLTHLRAAQTTSGRGWLPAYLQSEALLWPTYQALADALASSPPCGSEPAERWLGLQADAVSRFAQRWQVPTTVTKRMWLNRIDDVRLARDSRLPPDVRAYLATLLACGPDDWHGLHRMISAALRAELSAFADQLSLYAAFTPSTLRAARSRIPGVAKALACTL